MKVVAVLCQSGHRHGVREDIHKLGINPKDRRIIWATHKDDLERMYGLRGPDCVVYLESWPDYGNPRMIRPFLASRDFPVFGNIATAFENFDKSKAQL